MNCSSRNLKYILYLFNFLCALLGGVLIWFGVWLLNSVEDVKNDHGENLAAILTIVLGVVVLIVAVFGAVATFEESKGMLISYAVILVILLVIQLVLVSLSYIAASEGLSSGLKQGFDELWDKSEEHSNSNIDSNIDSNSTLSYYEQWLQCCGKNSAEDYFLLDKIPPSSCCRERDCTNVLNLFIDGCEQKFKAYVRAKTGNFNTISRLLIIIEFTSSIFACVLVDSIRNQRDRIRFYS